jgi:hypothetical protein
LLDLKQSEISALSNASFAFAVGTLPRSNRMLLVLTAQGAAGNESVNQGTFTLLRSHIMAGLEEWEPAALLLDFRELNYSWGDQMHRVLETADRWHSFASSMQPILKVFDEQAPQRFPQAIVVSEKCRDGLESLVSGEMMLDPGGCLFSEIESAAAMLDSLLVRG